MVVGDVIRKTIMRQAGKDYEQLHRLVMLDTEWGILVFYARRIL